MTAFFFFSVQLALNQTNSTISFLGTVLGPMMRLYHFDMDAGHKTILFKLLHLASIIHNPDGITFTKAHDNQNIISDEQRKKWCQHIRNMFAIVDKEIKALNRQIGRGQGNLSTCSVFVRMAARTSAEVSICIARIRDLEPLYNAVFCFRHSGIKLSGMWPGQMSK